MRAARGQFLAKIIAAFLAGLALPLLHAQADLRINVSRTNGNVAVSWRAETLVRPPGSSMFANYRVATSSNLVDWSAAGDVVSGSSFANREIRREFDPTELGVFVKVESIMDFSGLNFIRRPLQDGKFERATFFGCDLFSAFLDRCNLRNANLQAADFLLASLIEADLRGADLRGANFSNANLINADLRGAVARFVDFNGAVLSGADFAGADLRFSSLLGAQVDFIGLQNALIDEDTLFDPKTRLIWDLVNGKKVGATISNQVLTISNLRRADLRNTIWLNTDIRGSDLRGANLTGANLSGARLDFVDFRQTVISDSTTLSAKWRLVWRLNNEDFSNADLAGRDLSNASLTEARLAGANLLGANLQLAILVRINLHSAILRNARLQQVDATGANLQDADLAGADLTNANLLGANLTGAKTNATIFRNTTMPDGSIRN
jgi:uncharacterized protein YjbI with pentapeptide repeats